MKFKGWVFVFIACGLLAGGSASAAEEAAQGTGGPLDQRAQGPVPCLCGFDPEGGAFCSTAQFCPGLQGCAANSDCASGFKCLVDNCCPSPLDTGVCVPICEDGECFNPGVCGTFETECDFPLVVDLESFDAEWVDGRVTLTWTTTSEVDNAGFRILRARRDGSRVGKSSEEARELAVSLELLTQRMIPAQGDVLTGASYRHIDGAPNDSGRISYYLVDVDYAGVATLHGPVHVDIPPRAIPSADPLDGGGRSR